MHISLVLARLIQAFIVHVNDEGGGAIAYLADIGAPLNRAKDMVYVSVVRNRLGSFSKIPMNIQIVCGDSIILWRCFLVWNKDYFVIAIPFLMVLGTASTLRLRSLPIFFDIQILKSPDMVPLLSTSCQILMYQRVFSGLRACFLFQ